MEAVQGELRMRSGLCMRRSEVMNTEVQRRDQNKSKETLLPLLLLTNIGFHETHRRMHNADPIRHAPGADSMYNSDYYVLNMDIFLAKIYRFAIGGLCSPPGAM